MKRIILALTMLVAMVATASAQAEIKFEKVVHNFGTFEETLLCRRQYSPSPMCETSLSLLTRLSLAAVAPCHLIPSSQSLQVRRDRSVLPTMARVCSLVISSRASPFVPVAM